MFFYGSFSDLRTDHGINKMTEIVQSELYWTDW